MDREKRIALVNAMRTVLEAVSDADTFAAYDSFIPTREKMDVNPDQYINDDSFSRILDKFCRATYRAAGSGYWCDGVSSED